MTLLPGNLAAADSRNDDAADRLSKSADVLREVAAAGDKGIPEQVLTRAKCIVVVPNLVKAGLLVGGKYGRGAAVCRTDKGNEVSTAQRSHQAGKAAWSAPAFITLGGASIGLQIGAEGTDLVMLVMNSEGLKQLLASKLEFSVEGSMTAGTVGKSAAVGSTPNLNAELQIYSVSKGAFAGQALEGAVIEQDSDATKAIYGSDIPSAKILRGEVKVPASASPLLQEVDALTHQAAAQQASQQMPARQKQ
jgi:lipid-binding SYLF domain-containing protein